MITAKELTEGLKKSYEKQEKKYPRYTNWASDAGHPCLRYLVLCRTRWEDIPPLPAEIRPRLEVGNAMHDLAEKSFREAGFQVHTSPDSLQDKKLQVSGRMDFEIGRNGESGTPVEVKSVSDFEIVKYSSIEDILSGKWWVKKWISQLALYCWIRGKENGILHLRSMKTYRNIDLSITDKNIIDFVDVLMKNLESVNKHIADKTLPEPIDYDDFICGGCSAKSVCLRDIPIASGEVLLDDELENQLKRRDELKPMIKEYEELDKEIKEKTKGKTGICGLYQIGGRWVENKGGTKVIAPYKYWLSKIINIEKKEIKNEN